MSIFQCPLEASYIIDVNFSVSTVTNIIDVNISVSTVTNIIDVNISVYSGGYYV